MIYDVEILFTFIKEKDIIITDCVRTVLTFTVYYKPAFESLSPYTGGVIGEAGLRIDYNEYLARVRDKKIKQILQ
jgi:hypothetical protein